jgi:hypothetical protein
MKNGILTLAIVLLSIACSKKNESLPANAFVDSLNQTDGPVVTEVRQVSKAQALGQINFRRSELMSYTLGSQFLSSERYSRKVGNRECTYLKTLTKTVEQVRRSGGAQISVNGESVLNDTSPFCVSEARQRIVHQSVRELGEMDLNRFLIRLQRVPGDIALFQMGKSGEQDILIIQISKENMTTKKYYNLSAPFELGLVFLERTGSRGQRRLTQRQVR